MNRRELMLGTAAALAGAGSAGAQAAKEVVVGAIYPMSGSSAQVGADAKLAFDTALDIINNAQDIDLPTAANAGLAGLGGAKVRIVMADHQADPQKGRAEAERLITQEKVAAVASAPSIRPCRRRRARPASATAFPTSRPIPPPRRCRRAG